jgi:hypothetical protein
MFIELLRSLSPPMPIKIIYGITSFIPGFTLALGLLHLGIYLAYQQKKYLPLYIIAGAFLVIPWINDRYLSFLATRYIMPVILCACCLYPGTGSYIHPCIRLFRNKRSLMMPAFSPFAAGSIANSPFYSYCAQNAGYQPIPTVWLCRFSKSHGTQ